MSKVGKNKKEYGIVHGVWLSIICDDFMGWVYFYCKGEGGG